MTTNLSLYENEETDRLFRYPTNFRVADPMNQMQILRSWLGLQFTVLYNVEAWPKLPAGAEGYVTAPTTRSFSAVSPLANLGPALADLVARIRSHGTVHIENNLVDGLLRAKPRHREMLVSTPMIAPSVHAFPAQLGLYHGGRSPRRAEVRMAPNEFGLDPVTALAIVVTNWFHLQNATLRIDCPGAKYSPGGDPEKCTDTPRIDIAHGVIALDWNWNQRARGLHGSATGWLVA